MTSTRLAQSFGLILLASCLGGCSTETAAPMTHGVPLEPNERLASSAEVDQIVSPVPAARHKDYISAVDTLRIMGIERGDDTVGTYALMSNTKTWSTRHVSVGDLVGRNHRVTKIDESGVELQDRSGSKTALPVGRDTVVTRVLHRYDRVVRYQGKNVFTFAPGVAAELAQNGLGIETEEVTKLKEPGIKIVKVDEGMEAFALGFKPGDILFSIDGEACSTTNVAALFGKFSGSADIGVRMVRDGSMRTVRYHAP